MKTSNTFKGKEEMIKLQRREVWAVILHEEVQGKELRDLMVSRRDLISSKVSEANVDVLDSTPSSGLSSEGYCYVMFFGEPQSQDEHQCNGSGNHHHPPSKSGIGATYLLDN